MQSGRDHHGRDLTIGKPGMLKLGLGIDAKIGHLCKMSSEGCENDCTLSVLLQATQQLSQHLTCRQTDACQVLGKLLCGL